MTGKPPPSPAGAAVVVVRRPEDWGFPGFLTPDMESSLTLFRAKAEALMTKPHLLPDRHLLRFLRARKFDVDKAYKMLKDDLAWRKQFEGRVFYASDCPSLVKFCSNGCVYRGGFDRDGRPVLMCKLALAFPREVTDLNDLTMFWVSYVHLLTQACEAPAVRCVLRCVHDVGE